MVKDRIVYECSKVKDVAKQVSGAIENATDDDFDVLVELNQASHAEEYGEGQRPKSYFESIVRNGIDVNHAYLWRDANKICAIANILSEGRSKAVIGSFYTVPSERNKGYGYSLLHRLTEGLLNNDFEMCGLFSDVTNRASNKVFVDVGYIPVYKWIDVYKES